MIKATPGLSPIYVRYYDNASASVYNLTEDQYEHLLEEENGIDLAEKFEVELKGDGPGYENDFMLALAHIYGFGVGSE